MGSGRVLGVDACKAGWAGIALGDGSPRAYFAPLIGDLVREAGPVEVVAIDIPIGLPDAGSRAADELARKRVGPGRGSSVFTTPVRTALKCDEYAAAVAENRRLTQKGLSRQAYGLRTKVLQVNQWVHGQRGLRVVEVHPEVSFAEMAGDTLAASKGTWTGVEERRDLLAAAGITLVGAASQTLRRYSATESAPRSGGDPDRAQNWHGWWRDEGLRFSAGGLAV